MQEKSVQLANPAVVLRVIRGPGASREMQAPSELKGNGKSKPFRNHFQIHDSISCTSLKRLLKLMAR